jgi:hypothetical protein
MDRIRRVPMALEALILDGWVRVRYDPSLPLLPSKNTLEMVRWDHELLADAQALK